MVSRVASEHELLFDRGDLVTTTTTTSCSSRSLYLLPHCQSSRGFYRGIRLTTHTRNQQPLCRRDFNQDKEVSLDSRLPAFEQILGPANDADPPTTIYRVLLQKVGDEKALAKGRLLHAHFIRMGLGPGLLLGNLLIRMYGKCGAMDDAHAVFASMHQLNVFSWTLLMGAFIQSGMLDYARRVFDHMPERDVTSWNSMIAAYSQHERDREALELFTLMQLEGPRPDSLTFVSALAACAHVRDLKRCREIHTYVSSCGLEAVRILMNPLITMYRKCGSLKDTHRVFDKMEDRTVFTWNALIAAHVQDGYALEAFQLFKEMQMHGALPDEVTFITLLSSCASQKGLTDGRHMHWRVVQAALEPDVMIGNALISMYGRCGSINEAQRMFNRMWKRNVVSWNAMITVHAQHGQAKESLNMFFEMKLENIEPNKVTFVTILDVCTAEAALAEGKVVCACLSRSLFCSDVVVTTALLNMYGKCGNLGYAQEIFDSMAERDVISWNALIAAYVQHGEFNKACQLFKRMQEGCMQPNRVTVVNILIAYASQLAFSEGKTLHACIVGDGIERDILVGNSLINMYSKCGRMEDAWIVFNRLPKRDVVSWNAMIAAYGQHGLCKQALCLFKEMQLHGNAPNEVTFLSVLSACSHTGLVNEGSLCFASMEHVYRITPIAEHYNIMVDLLGRAGRLDDAEDIIKEMPVKPIATTWMGLLSASIKHRDLQRGVQCAVHVLDLDPDYDAAYVVLSDINVAQTERSEG